MGFLRKIKHIMLKKIQKPLDLFIKLWYTCNVVENSFLGSRVRLRIMKAVMRKSSVSLIFFGYTKFKRRFRHEQRYGKMVQFR